ncbi:MAG: peptide deformylase [Planctomycetia bacterium]|nr:peptide deformylase [Planctomycetia bacterium]
MKVVKYPHPILSYSSKPIRKIDQKLRDIVAEMFDLMYESQGVGLAANQVELPYQLFVMNATGNAEEKEAEFAFINPVIQRRKGREEGSEGCLSFPDLNIQINRAEEIIFQAIMLDGQLKKFVWKGFPARVVQHETDHLHGHCFFERAGLSGQLLAQEVLNDLKMIYETDQKIGAVPTREELARRIAQWEEERT